MSRYVQQLLIESGWTIDQSVLHNPIHIQQATPIVIPKSEAILNFLQRYVATKEQPAQKALTPSVLNDYIECTLKFYLKYIVNLREADEVEEDLDARIFGNLLHDVLYWFYDSIKKERNGLVVKADFADLESKLDVLIARGFRELYHLSETEPVVYEGQRVVVKEIVKEFARRALQLDEAYAPFTITLLEDRFDIMVVVGRKQVLIGGNIDRADVKDEYVRVIDYKTGADESAFEDIPSLFAHDRKRNKAAFQTMLYAYVYLQQNASGVQIVQPGLLNRKNLFAATFKFGHEMGKARNRVLVKDVRPLMNEFELHLKDLLNELFDPEIPFRQTQYKSTCSYCSFKELCHR
jgi:ATP-dependent helicase/DNAse subunit B